MPTAHFTSAVALARSSGTSTLLANSSEPANLPSTTIGMMARTSTRPPMPVSTATTGWRRSLAATTVRRYFETSAPESLGCPAR
jgi:hypothetical protein